MSQENDMELLTLFQSNPDQAITRLMAAHSGLVYSTIQRKGIDLHGIQDVMQDVWVSVLRKWHTFDPERGKLISWLAQMASNKAIDHIRKSSRYQRHMEEAEELQVQVEAEAVAARDERMEDLDVGHLLVQALDLLLENQRLVLDLHFYKGMSFQEIAASTGQPLSTVKSCAVRGMAKLRTMIRPA